MTNTIYIPVSYTHLDVYKRQVLWSVMAQDWERGATPRRTAQRLLGRVGSSSIICLHDRSMGKSADDTAPGRTIQALRLALPALQRAGFTFILPEEMAR